MNIPAIAIATMCATCLTLAGCKVERPGRLETTVIQWAKHRLTVGGKHNNNPVKDSAEAVEEGKQAFRFYCVVCHGLDEQSTGVPFATNMSPPTPSLASAEVQRYSDGQLKWIIENGISPSGMPASRGILGEDDMWAIVLYLRHLPPAGSQGVRGSRELGSPQLREMIFVIRLDMDEDLRDTRRRAENRVLHLMSDSVSLAH